jgi:hypothetical protein
MPRHDIDVLVRKTEEIQGLLKEVSIFEELIPIWRRPGWTTPAEFILVEGMLDSMARLSSQLIEMKQVVLKGSLEVGVGREVAAD